MKERLLIVLATAALIIAALRPALPSAPIRMPVAPVVPYGDCQDNGQCGP
jgi:hypothetical protein